MTDHLSEALDGNFADHLREVLREKDFDALSYEELRRIARHWIDLVDRRMEEMSESLGPARERQVEKLLGELERRGFSGLSRTLPFEGKFERALIELFLISRMRRLVLPYLSIQEGMELDGGVEATRPHISRLLGEILSSVGKRPWLALHFRCWGVRFRWSLDPLVHLRRCYCHQLRQTSGKRWWLPGRAGYHLFRFRLCALVFRMLSAATIWGMRAHLSEAGIQRMFLSLSGRRTLSLALLLLFPDSKSLKRSEWDELMERITNCFAPRLSELFRVIGDDALKSHGLAKLLKIGFGVIVWRLSGSANSRGNQADFIFDTLRLAYSWGTSYPLIDDVLDGESTEENVRAELIDGLKAVIGGMGNDSPALHPKDPGVREACGRLAEATSFLNGGQRPAGGGILMFLLESHARDSDRKLSEHRERLPHDIEATMWEDSLLKAALIRIATIELCGVPRDMGMLGRQMAVSLINQLGDDLWDVLDDLAGDRLTPFTAYLTGLTTRNPFTFFIRYSILMGDGKSARRQKALLVGAMETCRCLVKEIAIRRADPLSALEKLEESLKVLGADVGIGTILNVPHVDPDAVLFGLEESLTRNLNLSKVRV